MQPRDPDSQPAADVPDPKKTTFSSENDDLAKILKERVDAQRKLKKKEYEVISKKSFILRSQEARPEDQPVACR